MHDFSTIATLLLQHTTIEALDVAGRYDTPGEMQCLGVRPIRLLMGGRLVCVTAAALTDLQGRSLPVP
jgi:hypothetical protein